jgi:hypothetical protein
MKLGVTVSLATTMLLAGVRCSAGTLTLTDSGVWASGTPTTTESVAGESWDVSFQIASSPTPINYTTGVQTVVPITNMIFDLNGVAVQTKASGGSVELFTGEGFRLYFPNDDALQIQDATQLYSGSEASPTVLPGSYPPDFPNNAFLFDDATSGFYYFTSNNIVITSTAIPEPSSLLLFGAGLAVLAGVSRYLLRTIPQ